jgi:hypothetical protein
MKSDTADGARTVRGRECEAIRACWLVGGRVHVLHTGHGWQLVLCMFRQFVAAGSVAKVSAGLWTHPHRSAIPRQQSCSQQQVAPLRPMPPSAVLSTLVLADG